MDLLKVPRFSCQKRIHNKAHLNLVTEVLNGFSPGVFNRLYVNHKKNLEQPKFRSKERANNTSLLEPKSELMIILFSKVTLKATAINSES